MSSKTLLRSFAGGEITPELAGRLDLTKYQTGLSLARNFITLPHGPATRRPGFTFVNEARDSTQAVRLIPFSFSADQTVVLEFGHKYIRFHIAGGTLLEPAVVITSITSNSVVTTAPHGYSTGDWVYIGARYYKLTLTGISTFTVTDLRNAAATPSGTTATRVYTIATPYEAGDLFDLHYAQNADVLTIAHPAYPVKELKRLGATNWTLTDISFAAPSGAPANVVATATIGTPGDESPQTYVVTAVGADGVTETMASAPDTVSNNLSVAGNYNTITWNAVDGATRYNVYKQRGGTFGYIGQVRLATGGTPATIATATRPDGDNTVTVATAGAHGFTTGDVVFVDGTGNNSIDGAWLITVTGGSTFTFKSTKKTFADVTGGTASVPALALVDDNVLADTTQSPPEDIIVLNTDTDEYPSAVTYHEQRRWFAGTTEKPQVLFATRTGTESNLTNSIPSRDDDAMELRLAAAQNNLIRHLVPLSDLIALTAGGEFRIFADSAPAITPTSVSIKPQGYAGANNVQPAVTTGSLLYVQAQGSRVRDLSYNWESNAYRSIDVSIMAPHRFNGFTLTQLAYSRAPESILWAVRGDGTLLGLTYVPDQQVYGWHAHDTEGLFESVCVVAEENEDVLYAVVNRTISGRAVRYIERLHTRFFTDQADAFYVDSGLTYDGTPVTTISGLWHLDGKQVDILTDGAVHPRRTVVNGQVTLDYAASTVHVGLPVTADLRTLPLALEGMQAAGQGTVKNISKVHLRVSQSSVVQAGPTFTRLREYPARAVLDPYGSPPALRDGEITLSVDPAWNQDGAVCVRQDLPLPLTVLSMTLELQTGG